MKKAILALTFAWAAGNCLYVYLALDGARMFRLESAVYIFGVAALLMSITTPRVMTRRQDLPAAQAAWLAAAATVLWLAVFAGLLAFPLLSEDYGFRALYARPGSIFATTQFFRPAFAAVFAVVDALGGRASAVPLHLASAALHVGSAALASVLARRLSTRLDVALLTFALFLLNPLQLEAVLWVSGLQELLWSAAILGALVCYTRSAELTGADLAWTTGLTAIALLSKETAVAILLLLPLVDALFFRFRRGRLGWLAYAAVAIEVGAYLLVRSQFVSVESAFFVAPTTFLLKQLISIPYKTFVQPWNVEAVTIPSAALCAAALIALSAVFATAVMDRADSRLLFGPALILATTLPVYSYFFVDANLMSSRYIYVAAAGWAILAADTLSRLAPTIPSLLVALALLAALDFASLQANLRPWRVVGRMVTAMSEALGRGETDRAVVEHWRAELGASLEMRDGLPDSYKGVQVFRNGFPEFVRQATR